jgi:hypothetical protein
VAAYNIGSPIIADREFASEDVLDPSASRSRTRSTVRLNFGNHGLSYPTWLLALLFYVLAAVFTIGRYALRDPSTVCACVGTSDPAAYMWALSWWPHAIMHGVNPFVSHVLWAPTGVNVAQGAMIPTAAIIMMPLTAVAGPVVAYNALSVLSPILAAFTSYLLCRRLTKRELPAIMGGYLFGFSGYEFAQLTGHLNLTLIFLLPVAVHLALRRVDREISRRVYIAAMTLIFILQAGLSTELLADSVLIGGALLLGARWLVKPVVRSRVSLLIAETTGAGIIALLLAAPFFYYALVSGSFPKGAVGLSDTYALDLLNPIFPTYSTWLGHHDFLALGLSYESSNITEADGYLSVALIAAFVIWMVRDETPQSLRRIVVLAVGLTFILALGSHLHVAGITTLAMPFNWLRNLPMFNDLVPSRIIVFTILAMAVGIAMWLAIPGWRAAARWCLVFAGVLLIFPNMLQPLYGASPHNPIFFSTSEYRHYLKRGETVLVLPFGSNDVSMLWQAETGFYFYMPEGYVSGVVPTPFNHQLTAVQLVGNVAPPAAAFGAFIREHAVSDVVVDPGMAGSWPALLMQLGLHPQAIGGVSLYHVPEAPA